jgi:large subunit ribosomal protein L6
VTIKGNAVDVKGPKGSLHREFVGVLVRQDGNKLVLEPKGEGQQIKALWGLGRSLLANMVEGVANGFKKELRVEGTGYRVEQKGPAVSLAVGYSNPKEYVPPQGVKLVVVGQTAVTVEGIDKELVGQVAAEIRGIKPPEPYKGKGVRYATETVRRKAGKSGKK